MKSSMTEASDLVWLTSSSNHAINGGSVFWGESPSGTLKTPAPSKGGVDWNPIPFNIGQFAVPAVIVKHD